jgi:hypothetical protein
MKPLDRGLSPLRYLPPSLNFYDVGTLQSVPRHPEMDMPEHGGFRIQIEELDLVVCHLDEIGFNALVEVQQNQLNECMQEITNILASRLASSIGAWITPPVSASKKELEILFAQNAEIESAFYSFWFKSKNYPVQVYLCGRQRLEGQITGERNEDV